MNTNKGLPGQKLPSFAERFAYLRWLKHLALGKAPTNKQIGESAGVTGEAVIGWVKRSAPPPDYAMVKGLVRYFAVEDREAWFVKGEGEPPDIALWQRWRSERAAVSKPPYVEATADEIEERLAPVAKKRRRQGGRRR